LGFLKETSEKTPIETIWHLAANSDIQAGGLDPDVDLKATFLTTYNVLKMAQALGISQLAFASTSAIYGEHPGLLREDAGPLFPNTKERLNYFNIAPPDSATTVREIAEMVVRAAAPGAKIRYTGGSKGWVGDVARFSYSIEKLKATGWTPRLTSNQAVELAVQ